jgi:hypothetical protein
MVRGAFDIDEIQAILSQKVEFPLCRKTSSEVAVFSATVGVGGDAIDRGNRPPSYPSPQTVENPPLIFPMKWCDGRAKYRRPDRPMAVIMTSRMTQRWTS